VNNITHDGVTIIWETTQPEVGKVAYGAKGDFSQEAAAAEEAQIHRVRISGLEPEAVYNYRVSAGGETRESSFKTGPAEPRPITFVLIGDSRRWDTRWEETKMQEHAAQWNPEFYLTMGDLVVNGHMKDLWPEHFARFDGLIDNMWMVTARGNHEGSQMFDPANDWFAKYHELPGDGEPYAVFTWGNTHFVLVSFEATFKAHEFLDEHLATVDSQYTIVAHHFPVYCTGYYSPDDNRKEVNLSSPGWPQLAASIDKHAVDLDISGHTHIYERMYPIKDKRRNDREGTTYVVNGGDIGSQFPEKWTAVADDEATQDKPTYTVFHMGEDRIWFRTFVWSKEKEAISEIDYAVLWKDEAVPQEAMARLEGATGDELISTIKDLGAMIYHPAAEKLVAYLDHEDIAVAQAAATAIRGIGIAEVSPVIVDHLGHEDPVVRRELVRAIEIAMDPAIAPKVAEMVKNPETELRSRIALTGALEFHAPPSLTVAVAVDLLQNAETPQPLRERAVYALSRVASKEDLAKLGELFREEASEYVTIRLAWAFNKITGRQQSLHDKAPIARSEPGPARDEFIGKWMEWHEKKEQGVAYAS
jgi:hypothetical protein